MNEMERLHKEMSRWMEELRRNALGITGATSQWQPSLNAYRLADQFVICVDIAGMNKKAISVKAEARRLHIAGTRPPPEPARKADEPAQTLAMEIDYGPFERVLELPEEVDAERVTANYREGLLWITLPLARQTIRVTPVEEDTP
jgi:HSP20 family protein